MQDTLLWLRTVNMTSIYCQVGSSIPSARASLVSVLLANKQNVIVSHWLLLIVLVCEQAMVW